MKTKKVIGLLAAAAVIAMSSCAAPKAFTGPNPLDVPGAVSPTVSQLHANNMARITGNPTFSLR